MVAYPFEGCVRRVASLLETSADLGFTINTHTAPAASLALAVNLMPNAEINFNTVSKLGLQSLEGAL
jgi:hypothetical protein